MSETGRKRKHGETQGIILRFIQEQIEERGYPPSVREICDATGLKSTSTVHGHLKRMEKAGLLQRDSMKPRAMTLLKKNDPEEKAGVRLIPLMGPVAAGSPILAEESIDETLPVPDYLITKEGDYFALVVRGESMIDAGILNGDYLIVRKQPVASNGDIVVALLEDDATVKRFFKENGHFRLQPENAAMKPIIVKELTILGKVVSVYRAL
ncbi:MAG: transcriptional repressor LexA [Eubacteriales bacterium]|nr:transcriptional repressor LexA [Eubacteriales bacterium]